MKLYNAKMVVSIPYSVQAEDLEQAGFYIEELFEEEYPDLKVFAYNIEQIKEIK